MNLNKKWYLSWYVYFILLWITIISWTIITWSLRLNHYSAEFLNKTKSFYAAETGIEEWLLTYKRNPDIEDFIPNNSVISEKSNKRITEFDEQNIFKRELMVHEVIEAWKSIQLPFAKRDLDSRITKFHIWLLKYDNNTPPEDNLDCNTPQFDATLEVSAYQRALIYATEPVLDYSVELNSNWNWCYIGNNNTWKTSLITYSDPYSNEKVSLVWDKCIMNNKWNVTWSVFEEDIRYVLNDRWDADITNNTCDLDCSGWNCSNFYTHNSDILEGIHWYQIFYTIWPNFIWWDMTDEWLIVLDLRAVDNDAHVVVWATDDVWNPYEIPWRYINFSSLWISQWWDLEEWLFTRLKLKKKWNKDLLSIFNYALFSESEVIK